MGQKKRKHLEKNNDTIEHLRQKNACGEEIMEIMHSLDRAWFVPDEAKPFTAGLKPISIGHKQTISAPFIVASMSELLEVFPDAKTLEIGTGCGYQSAVLLELEADLYTIEFVPQLAEFGRKNLENLNYTAHYKCGDGTYGWKEHAPYDRIIITATAPSIPKHLINQLKVGGIMVFPLRQEDDRQMMVKIIKKEDKLEIQKLYGVRFVPFVGDINIKS